MRRHISIVLTALLSIAVFSQRSSAQNLTISLFERYLEALRVDAAIPGLSVAVVQNGSVWAQGLGRQDVDAASAARPDTPYLLGDLSQVFGSTVLLRKCIEESYTELSDRVVVWSPQFPEPTTTLRDLLAHAAPGGGFRYDTTRYAELTPVIAECADVPYPQVLGEQFSRLGMMDSVPGHALIAPTLDDRAIFDAGTLARYGAVLRRLAVPYRVVNRQPSRSDVTPLSATTSTGVVSTAVDLAKFVDALDDGVVLQAATRQQAWTNVSGMPTGLGWFVQSYNGERIVWQFGLVRDAYSSLILKVPGRDVTLVLLANSGGLSAPFALENGDVTRSLFATLFLRLFVS